MDFLGTVSPCTLYFMLSRLGGLREEGGKSWRWEGVRERERKERWGKGRGEGKEEVECR